MSKPSPRRFRLVLPQTNRTALLPRPRPVSATRHSLLPRIMEHIDHLQVLAVEKPDVMQGILDTTKLLAAQCRRRAVQRR